MKIEFLRSTNCFYILPTIMLEKEDYYKIVFVLFLAWFDKGVIIWINP